MTLDETYVPNEKGSRVDSLPKVPTGVTTAPTDSGCATASHADLVRGARVHYDDVSNRACDWSSSIVHAIDAWEREPELLAALKLARHVLEVACGTDAPYIRQAFAAIDPAIAKAEAQ